EEEEEEAEEVGGEAEEEEEEEEEEDEEPDESEEEEDDFEDDVELDLDDEPEEIVEPIFEEEAGYAEGFDWSSLSDEDRTRHREILGSSAEQLAELALKKLSTLDRWAAAQAQARAGQRSEF